MAANDPDVDKLRPLKKVCLLIRFQQIRIPLLIALLQKICLLEHVKAEFEALEHIAQNSRGDVRSAINDLQSLSEAKPCLNASGHHGVDLKKQGHQHGRNAPRVLLGKIHRLKPQPCLAAQASITTSF